MVSNGVNHLKELQKELDERRDSQSNEKLSMTDIQRPQIYRILVVLKNYWSFDLQNFAFLGNLKAISFNLKSNPCLDSIRVSPLTSLFKQAL